MAVCERCGIEHGSTMAEFIDELQKAAHTGAAALETLDLLLKRVDDDVFAAGGLQVRGGLLMALTTIDNIGEQLSGMANEHLRVNEAAMMDLIPDTDPQ